MTADLHKCTERFARLAFRASHFATNPAAYMFTPRAMHVIPPVVKEHVAIASKLDKFYREYTHACEVKKGISLVLENAREYRLRGSKTRVAYKKALAKWGKVRIELTQTLYKEVFGDK